MLKAVRNRVPEWLKIKFSGPLRIIMRKEAVYFFSFLLDGPTTELKISKNQSLLDGAQAKLKDT